MTDFERRAFMFASGQVLTADLPENFDDEDWSNDEHDDIDAWIVNHAWEPYEYWEAKQLWEQIDSVAYTLKSFHESEVKLALDTADAPTCIRPDNLVK